MLFGAIKKVICPGTNSTSQARPSQRQWAKIGTIKKIYIYHSPTECTAQPHWTHMIIKPKPFVSCFSYFLFSNEHCFLSGKKTKHYMNIKFI